MGAPDQPLQFHAMDAANLQPKAQQGQTSSLELVTDEPQMTAINAREAV
jgi:hypothetical protein